MCLGTWWAEAKEVLAYQHHIGSRWSVKGSTNTDTRGVVGLVERLFVGSGVKLVRDCSDWWIMVHQRDCVLDIFVAVP